MNGARVRGRAPTGRPGSSAGRGVRAPRRSEPRPRSRASRSRRRAASRPTRRRGCVDVPSGRPHRITRQSASIRCRIAASASGWARTSISRPTRVSSSSASRSTHTVTCGSVIVGSLSTSDRGSAPARSDPHGDTVVGRRIPPGLRPTDCRCIGISSAARDLARDRQPGCEALTPGAARATTDACRHMPHRPRPEPWNATRTWSANSWPRSSSPDGPEAVDELVAEDFVPHSWPSTGDPRGDLKRAIEPRRRRPGGSRVHRRGPDRGGRSGRGPPDHERDPRRRVHGHGGDGEAATRSRRSTSSALRDGQVVEHWHQFNPLALMQQLGVSPPQLSAGRQPGVSPGRGAHPAVGDDRRDQPGRRDVERRVERPGARPAPSARRGRT